MSQQLLDTADPLDEMADRLAWGAVVFRRLRGLEKQADPIDWSGMSKSLLEGGTPGWETARNALIGGGVGATAGALGIGSEDHGDGKRHSLADMMRMGLLGAAVGGGGTLALRGGQQALEAGEAEKKIEEARQAEIAGSPAAPHPSEAALAVNPLMHPLADIKNRLTGASGNLKLDPATNGHHYGNVIKQLAPLTGQADSSNIAAAGDIAAPVVGGVGGGYLAGKGYDFARRHTVLPRQIQDINAATDVLKKNSPAFAKTVSEATPHRWGKSMFTTPGTPAKAGVPGTADIPLGGAANPIEQNMLNTAERAANANASKLNRYGRLGTQALGAGVGAYGLEALYRSMVPGASQVAADQAAGVPGSYIP